MVIFFVFQVYDEDDRAGYWGDARKCDMPLRTIEAMYRNIRYNHPDIDWIYWTGDLPPHDIWMQTKEGNSEIVRGTARQLKKHFPGQFALNLMKTTLKGDSKKTANFVLVCGWLNGEQV